VRAAAVILAAGKSTRMKSELPKVLHEVCGRPMLAYVLDACRGAGVEKLVVVVGHRKDDVIAAFAGCNDITWVEQREQKGTGHAALVCKEALAGFAGRVLVIAGDMPLVRQETLQNLLAASVASGDAVTLATCQLDDPTGYGRIVRGPDGKLTSIIEDHDCTPEQRAIREVNVSYYCFDGERVFGLLEQVKPTLPKGEYYITDTITLALAQGAGAGAVLAVPPEDAMGVNSRADLAVINRLMQGRIQAHWMANRVTIVDPQTTWIESGATLGAETTIAPFSFVGTCAEVGENCRIGPFGYVGAQERVAAGAVVRGALPAVAAKGSRQ
jgi:bifunctional UDP-N-acetylglucosamine pyrophosphorylase/glucosamine-1-phosphate N-acetyltransferase